MRRACTALLGLAALATASGQAPAMAPTGAPRADLTFIISAKTANFSSPTHLELGDVAYTAQFTGNGKTGVYPIGLFANSTEGAPFLSTGGAWLGGPQAVLYGSNFAGNMTAVFLNLAAPQYDPKANTLSFNVSTTAAAKYSGGAVANALKDFRNSVGPEVDATVDATSEYHAVALFLDTNRLALGKTSETKWFGWGGGWGGGWGHGGWGHGGWGGGWNGYGNNWGYYQPQYYYQPSYGYGCGCGK